ncbi:hypothetical protein WOLCODRAFT_93681 [Wolfiporia cocos MD-104 SS10]|uniref:Uncharacterized protein n=1 Tax=Wolfiporia cocos (strain MD-104) TaxID=742152 RepID=A0A2H3IV01_WOLCO|nr:hypothetical protein WOLCODRAFT_93681 [Wolfiporia cocos MD-104 SS10]
MPTDSVQEPPPVYSPEPPEDEESLSESGATVEPQILIVPTASDGSFQKGYLGAEGERAAIEGELQLKCAETFRWERITMLLQTVEQSGSGAVQLFHREIELSGAESESGRTRRSSFPFAIPLAPDAPQCLHLAHSSLTHTLTARVFAPGGAPAPALTKSVAVHTRRYSAHQSACAVCPETRVLDEPTRVEVQVPRTAFRASEPVPVYVTVLVPRRELVVEQGLRLRNIRAELLRCVQVERGSGSVLTHGNTWGAQTENPGEETSSSPAQNTNAEGRSSSEPRLREEIKVVSLSGAGCQLHPTQPIRIRLVLHHPPETLLSAPAQDLPTADYYTADAVDCASISQTTVLHSVSFRLDVRVTFMHMSSRTERVSSVSFPLTILPRPAPLPEVEQSIDSAYHKKHDRPPTRTVRTDDMDVPLYEEGEAGPSGAPPPFEEREAPPPFFSTEPEASSSRLPTFLESEREVYVPTDEDSSIELPPPLVIEGEGVLFGFTTAEQFDGHADMDRSFTPPPTVEMATRDTNVTQLANLSPNVAMEALGLALGLDHPEEDMEDGPPPPPPPMDDPSDPPPSIDSDFRGPEGDHHSPASHLSQPRIPPGLSDHPSHDAAEAQDESHGHAPPPYRVPDHEAGQDHATHPPPYMDLVHHSH